MDVNDAPLTGGGSGNDTGVNAAINNHGDARARNGQTDNGNLAIDSVQGRGIDFRSTEFTRGWRTRHANNVLAVDDGPGHLTAYLEGGASER